MHGFSSLPIELQRYILSSSSVNDPWNAMKPRGSSGRTQRIITALAENGSGAEHIFEILGTTLPFCLIRNASTFDCRRTD